MNTRPVGPRSEADPRFTWALSDLYSNDEAWQKDFDRLQEMVQSFGAFAGTLGQKADALLGFLQAQDDMEKVANVVFSYSFRKADQDTRDAASQALRQKSQDLWVQINQALSFATPEILAIPDETMEKFYREQPKLEQYRLALTRIMRKKAHTLSPEMEQFLSAAGQISQTPSSIFSMFDSADVTFPDAVDSQGNKHPVTHGTFISLLESDDRSLRKSAFESVYGVYGRFSNTLAAMLNGQMKQLQFYADCRKYPSALHAALDKTEVPVEIYHNLIETVHAHLPSMHRYVRLRKKALGVDKLHYYDLYNPIVADQAQTIDYEQAKEISFKALAPLGQDYLNLLKEGYDNRWIDVYENIGKRSGAYSAGVYGSHPFVLMNYTDTLSDAFTLVHEMGHALHSCLTNRTQPVTYADYVIFVAEVASTCNESLMMQYLLQNTTDSGQRAYLVNHFINKFRSTLYRQTMFAEFELWCSEQVRLGNALTAKAICEKYAQLNHLYYGEDIVADPEIAMEWARIPHFYRNFYVYQYATGFSCAIALSQRILKEGESAVRDYLNFLSSGCCQDPVSLLKGAGVDISTPKPIEDALELFDELIDELERSI